MKLQVILKLRLLGLAAALTLAACSGDRAPAAAPTPATSGPANDVRRLSAILDYVAADYVEAVQGGQIVNQAEYDEQIIFLDEADAFTKKIPDQGAAAEVLPRIASIRELVEGKADAAKVSAACRAVRSDLLDAYDIVLAPMAPPSYERGKTLYVANCARCHGESGGADGPAVPTLKPPMPRSFLDPDVMVGLSPVRAYNALTDGIDGTSMASFSLLPASDRWSLAFYVFTLRHDAEAAARGKEAAAKLPAELLSLAGLAEANDGQLSAALADAGVPEADRAAALAYLRRESAFVIPDGSIPRAQSLVAAAVKTYESGDPKGAQETVTAAYLDGFEPVEATLSAHDAALVADTEAAFFALREAMAAGVAPPEVQAAADALTAKLAAAQRTLEGGTGATIAFAAAATILVREGIESVLLVLLLLGLVRRAGETSELRYVHAGWGSAVGIGVLLWFAVGAAVVMSGAQREVLEGVIALLAAGVLLYASHFVLARLDAQRRIEALKRKFAGASPARRRGILFGLAFAAVFREVFEVVLFLKAILLESPDAGTAVALGMVTGLAICGAFFAVLRVTGKRLSPGQILTASGAILCVLAVVMAGKGVRALQEAGLVSSHTLALPRVELLGVYPTVETVAVQLAMVGAIGAIAYLGLRQPKAA